MTRTQENLASARLQDGFAAHQSGDLDLADSIYREVLAYYPDHADALHLSGVIAHQLGRRSESVERISQAIKINQGSAVYYNNLGVVLRDINKLKDALLSFDAALKLTPYYPEAVYNRGMTLHDLELFEEALGMYNEAIRMRPDYAAAFLNRGITLMNLGRPLDAIKSYDDSIRIRPNHAAVFNNRALALVQLGRVEEAMQSFDRAINLNPNYSEALYNRANNLFELNRFAEALDGYDAVIRIGPPSSSVCHKRGIALLRLDRPQEALASFTEAICLAPDFSDALLSRGGLLLSLGVFDEALADFNRALQFTPTNAHLFNNCGNALLGLGRVDEALQSYENATHLNPGLYAAFFNRGIALKRLGRLGEALQSYDEAILLDPESSDAFNNRGGVLAELMRFDDALASFDEAIRLRQGFADAHRNRGDALRALNRFYEAIKAYDEAIRIQPESAEAFLGRGNAQLRVYRLSDAIGSYEEALRLKPGNAFLLGVAISTYCRICRWGELEHMLSQVVDRARSGLRVSPPFPLLALVDDPKIHIRVAGEWVKGKLRSTFGLPYGTKTLDRTRLHIAYISADFHDHATSYLMAELFELHDRNRFQLTAISFGPDNGKAIRDRISAAFDRFEDVRQMGDLDVARLCRELGVDIAVDLKGYTQDSRPGILAERCAPIQINWLGYPGSMAAPFIDYIVADRTLITEQDLEHYTEKVIWLPDTYQVNDGKRHIADKQFTRSECGLPARGFVFCCFNNNYKILPATFDVWMRILKRVPDSVLWLFEDNPIAAKNLRAEAMARGVDSARLVFGERMPIAEHLARHRLADLFIDTWPYNAHTTASDALWAGLPVLTRTGNSFASRVAASLLKAIGLLELITDNDHDYEELAVTLAQDPVRLGRLKNKLAANRLTYPLFDCKKFTRSLESAYQAVMERYWEGRRPGNVLIQTQAVSSSLNDTEFSGYVAESWRKGWGSFRAKSTAKIKVNLYDPALVNRAGHHYDIDFRLIRRMIERGYDVQVYSNAAIQADVKSDFEALAPVTPCFSISPYRRPTSFDSMAGSQLLFQDTTSIISKELAQTRAADLWFWPTIFAAHLNACAHIPRAPPISACVHVAPGDEYGQLRELWRLAFINAKRAKLDLNIGAIEQELVYLFSELMVDGVFKLFPAPHDGWPLDSPKKACERIGFYGHQRSEKGSLDLISEVSGELVKRGFKITLQNSAGTVGAVPDIESIGFVESLAQHISRCDLVILPYDRGAYRYKGSGILWEALATGVPVIVTQGTAPERLVRRLGTGTSISVLDSAVILGAVDKICENYSGFARAAFVAATEWRAQNSTDRFIAECLGESSTVGSHDPA
jgi:protein O-GlcNAc transferase